MNLTIALEHGYTLELSCSDNDALSLEINLEIRDPNNNVFCASPYEREKTFYIDKYDHEINMSNILRWANFVVNVSVCSEGEPIVSISNFVDCGLRAK